MANAHGRGEVERRDSLQWDDVLGRRATASICGSESVVVAPYGVNRDDASTLHRTSKSISSP